MHDQTSEGLGDGGCAGPGGVTQSCDLVRPSRFLNEKRRLGYRSAELDRFWRGGGSLGSSCSCGPKKNKSSKVDRGETVGTFGLVGRDAGC
eukprot:m.91926 g.91926  ORF g.91926 m.91926 type:complete len:91 (-) comp12967_c0_seq5:1649-1921(-)